MTKLRVIGDCHGCINNRNRLPNKPSYIEICQQLYPQDYSVQLGDMGFDYTSLQVLNPNQHTFFFGNHDNLDTYYDCPNSLGNFGNVGLGPFEFFFVRGALSIDKKARIQHEAITGQKSWWQGEELSIVEGLDCLDCYETFLPKVVMSHDCPYIISQMIGNPDMLQAFGWKRNHISATQELLQQMLDIHKPDLWLAGHYHINRKIQYQGTTFIFIGERDFIDFNSKWEIIHES